MCVHLTVGPGGLKTSVTVTVRVRSLAHVRAVEFHPSYVSIASACGVTAVHGQFMFLFAAADLGGARPGASESSVTVSQSDSPPESPGFRPRALRLLQRREFLASRGHRRRRQPGPAGRIPALLHPKPLRPGRPGTEVQKTDPFFSDGPKKTDQTKIKLNPSLGQSAAELAGPMPVTLSDNRRDGLEGSRT